jgi:hypothetical protein
MYSHTVNSSRQWLYGIALAALSAFVAHEPSRVIAESEHGTVSDQSRLREISESAGVEWLQRIVMSRAFAPELAPSPPGWPQPGVLRQAACARLGSLGTRVRRMMSPDVIEEAGPVAGFATLRGTFCHGACLRKQLTTEKTGILRIVGIQHPANPRESRLATGDCRLATGYWLLATGY